MNLQKVPDAADDHRATVGGEPVRGVKEIGAQILKPRHVARAAAVARRHRRRRHEPVAPISASRCCAARASTRSCASTCHGPDGKGAPMAGAADGRDAGAAAGRIAARAGAPRVRRSRCCCNGLTGPIDGQELSGRRHGADGQRTPTSGSPTSRATSATASATRRRSSRRSRSRRSAKPAPQDAVDARRAAADVPTPLTNAAEWKVTREPQRRCGRGIAIGSDAARWDTGAPQQPGMWFQIELPQAATVTEVQLDSAAPGSGFLGLTPPRGQTPTQGGAGGRPNPGASMRSGVRPQKRGDPKRRGLGLPAAGGPVAYTLQLSMDGTTWGAPVAQGAGETPTTVIPFAAAQARFIRITQTGAAANGEFWGIQQVRLYGRTGH